MRSYLRRRLTNRMRNKEISTCQAQHPRWLPAVTILLSTDWYNKRTQTARETWHHWGRGGGPTRWISVSTTDRSCWLPTWQSLWVSTSDWDWRLNKYCAAHRSYLCDNDNSLGRRLQEWNQILQHWAWHRFQLASHSYDHQSPISIWER